MSWKMAQVVKLIAGKDKIVRKVELHTEDAGDKLIKINRAIDSLYPLDLEAGHITRQFIPQKTGGTVTSTGRLLNQGSKGECKINSDRDLNPVTNDSPPKANLMCQVETPSDLTPGAEETSTTASQTITDVPSTGAEVLSPVVSEDTPDTNKALNEEVPEQLKEEPKLRVSKRTTRAGKSRARWKSDLSLDSQRAKQRT
jgi:hypothetical protein